VETANQAGQTIFRLTFKMFSDLRSSYALVSWKTCYAGNTVDDVTDFYEHKLCATCCVQGQQFLIHSFYEMANHHEL
jgi:hypothetical protein